MTVSCKSVKNNGYNHEYVDLGLPSGTLWATCNVGATKPTEYGDLFAWGEPTPKETFTWENYKWCNGNYNTLTKYNSKSKYGTVDNKKVLEPQDDAATVNWGNKWRMPTTKEQYELVEGCDWEWTDNYEGSGVAGRIGKSKHNGNTIFLPAAGYCKDNGRNYEDKNKTGGYWSSSPSSPTTYYAWHFFFGLTTHDIRNSCGQNYDNRSIGRSVRAVCSKK